MRLFPTLLTLSALLVACTPSDAPSGEGAAKPAEAAPAKALETASNEAKAPPVKAVKANKPPAAKKAAASNAADGLNRGDKAADFTGRIVYGPGSELTLSDFVGPGASNPKDGAIVAFGASWCGYCKTSLETLKELQATHENLQIVYVGTDTSESGWQKEITIFEQKELNFPLVRVADPIALRREYFGNKQNIPRFYLVDYNGVIRIKDQGFTKKKMGKLLPKQVRYLLGVAERERAATSGASAG